ncbi:MAG: right-handed parallel beta-helix repeat-containing protein, partial [Actinomycetes bacterium]
IDIVNSDIEGSYENPIDYVAVQHSLIGGNRIHAGDDWCTYVKGGSAYIKFTHNEVYNCGTGGFSAGQGTGFEYMVAPWLRYEAYGVTVTDNVIHDTWGAGLGVNGSYNVVMAFNTLYRIGTRSHAVEFVHGARGCDGNTAQCAANLAAGGWGVVDSSLGGQWIPSKHIQFLNNIVYNPAGVQTAWQHFAIGAPITPPTGSGLPAIPALADDDLQIHGNVIWNGPADMETGIDDPTKRANLLATNWVNVMTPQLRNPAAGDFRPTVGGNIAGLTSPPIPTLSWSDVGLGVPDGGSPTISTDRPPGALR